MECLRSRTCVTVRLAAQAVTCAGKSWTRSGHTITTRSSSCTFQFIELTSIIMNYEVLVPPVLEVAGTTWVFRNESAR